MAEVVVRASPSLALIKYWGKQDPERNIPATPSLSLNLREFHSETRVVTHPGQDRMLVEGRELPPQRYHAFFENVRAFLGKQVFFHAESSNNFPTAAGLASSSSGFAALAWACVLAADGQADLEQVSALARLGSASAARAVFGGFVLLPAGAEHATQLQPPAFWPEIRILVVRLDARAKPLSSRQAMEQVRMTSPYYPAWVERSPHILEQALIALDARDISMLGHAVRNSYMSMFGTMLGADPPILYWKPESVAVIRACRQLREEGLNAWETMDAGPQVKILCLEHEVATIRERLVRLVPVLGESDCFVETRPGPGMKQIS